MTTVSVIVPAYNEGPGLGANLVALTEQFSHYSCYDVQYIIVDDGSADQTQAVAQTFARFRPNVTVVTHERNGGLGQALRSGIARATGEYTVVIDADLSYTPAVAMELLETLERDNADIVLASPYMKGGSVKNVPFVRRVLSREANSFLSLATKGQYATLTCMVRAYRTALLKALRFRSSGMEATAEILLTAIRKKANIVELPARLEWNADRKVTHGIPNIGKITKQTLSTVRLALSHRPALLLAMPGLIPGSWPLVVGILLLMHANAKELAIGSAAILAVQYTSLAIFAGQLGQFFTNAFRHSRAARSKACHL
jgi:glycosyltransferase involved in cell wall biosynthesis